MKNEEQINRYDYYGTFYEKFCHVENDKLMMNSDIKADQVTSFIDKIINNLEKELKK